MKLSALPVLVALLLGCSPNAPKKSAVAVDELMDWQKTTSDGPSVIGSGTTTLTLRNPTETAMSVALGEGQLVLLTLDGEQRRRTLLPVPNELRTLLPCTIPPGESVSTTFPSSGRIDPNKAHRVQIPLVIQGAATIGEGPVHVHIQ